MEPVRVPDTHHDRSNGAGGLSNAAIERIAQELIDRVRKDDAILKIIATRPELQVQVTRRTIEADGDSLRGQVAILISEKFFDDISTGNAAFNELKRRGKSVAKPSVYRECDKLAEMGFLTKEADGYRAVPGMKVNIIEA